jgi:hypothetical protein
MAQSASFSLGAAEEDGCAVGWNISESLVERRVTTLASSTGDLASYAHDREAFAARLFRWTES